MSFEERAKSHFIEMMKKQNFEWQMIEAGLLEEEQEVKPIKPKKKIKKELNKRNKLF